MSRYERRIERLRTHVLNSKKQIKNDDFKEVKEKKPAKKKSKK